MLTPAEEDLINKLLDGRCTEEELDRAFPLVSRLPEDRAMVVMEKLWEQSNYRERLPSSFFKRIEARIRRDKSRQARPATSRRLTYWMAAATVLLILAIGGWMLFGQQEVLRTTATAFAEQKTVRLPDGSLVRLNANSSLTYSEDWDATEDRRVELVGEAFFEVSPKPATRQKFLVVTPDLTVAVLGTVFNVNSRAEKTSVFLEEGRIALQLTDSPKEERVMQAGELVTYSADSQELVAEMESDRPEVHTSWKDGVLVFDNTPLREVLEKVENIYGIQLEVSDPGIYEREITAGLPMEEITIVLPLLEQVLGYSIEGKEGVYRITE